MTHAQKRGSRRGAVHIFGKASKNQKNGTQKTLKKHVLRKPKKNRKFLSFGLEKTTRNRAPV